MMQMMRKVILFIALLLCVQPTKAPPAFAALAVSGTPAAHDQDVSADPVTFNYTTVSGANLLLIGCSFSTNAITFVGATFDSVAMTEITNAIGSSATSSVLYRLINPNIGTLAFSLDLDAADDGGCGMIAFSGADTTTPISGTITQTGSDTSTTVSVTCPVGSIAVSIGGRAGLEAVTVDGSQTTIANGDDGSGQYFMSYEISTASPVSMDYTWTTSASRSHIGVCVNAAAATIKVIAPITIQ